ncbi:MAG: Altered inheritance of mitochondria protein 6 [Candelina mexicana]|nr:MAG: Altered inheritance of mitochondria protein 6 [Candelina mexicana]
MASKRNQDDESGASLLGSTSDQRRLSVSPLPEDAEALDPLFDDEVKDLSRRRTPRWDYIPFMHDEARRRTGRQVSDSTDEKSIAGRRRRHCRTSIKVVFWVLVVLGVCNIVGFFVSLGRLLWGNDLDRILSDWGKPGHEGEGLAKWPTDFSRDIMPIACHSHNDYWRRVPLYDAISAGCISVEADIWLYDDELYVGHDTSSLTRNRTLRNLYLNPIVDILEKQNPSTNFTHPSDTISGIFDTEPSQPLTLLIDFKMDGNTTWPYLVNQLEPLLRRGYLTTFNGTDIVPGPVIIVGTGNTPFNLVTANTTRHIFFDAPLDEMWEEDDPSSKESPLKEPSSKVIRSTYKKRHRDGPSEFLPHPPPPPNPSTPSSPTPLPSNNTYTPQNSYFASVSFGKAVGRMWRNQLSASQMNIIRGHIRGAHRRGLKARYWDLPNWPIGFRNHVWDILVKERIDLLNVDDLKGATKVDWREREGWF